jgi:hypothetical protein
LSDRHKKDRIAHIVWNFNFPVNGIDKEEGLNKGKGKGKGLGPCISRHQFLGSGVGQTNPLIEYGHSESSFDYALTKMIEINQSEIVLARSKGAAESVFADITIR